MHNRYMAIPSYWYTLCGWEESLNVIFINAHLNEVKQKLYLHLSLILVKEFFYKRLKVYWSGLFNFICGECVTECIHMCHVHAVACRCQKRVQEFWELELEVFLSHHVAAMSNSPGTETRLSTRPVSVLNCQAIPPAPTKAIFKLLYTQVF